MTTINNFGNGFFGTTGSGLFVGSASPVLTGAIDCGGATTLKIPNSAAPTVSTNGDLAVDTTFSNFSGMMTYYSGSQQYCPAILPADINATDAYLVAYNLASTKFVMQKQSGLVQYVIFTDNADGATSSTSMVNTTLTANITPNSASNKIWIMAYACDIVTTASTNVDGYATYDLRRTTGTATTLATTRVGVDNGAADSTDTRSMIALYGYETAPDTNAHTYVLRHSVPSASHTSTYQGSRLATMILLEMLP